MDSDVLIDVDIYARPQEGLLVINRPVQRILQTPMFHKPHVPSLHDLRRLALPVPFIKIFKDFYHLRALQPIAVTYQSVSHHATSNGPQKGE